MDPTAARVAATIRRRALLRAGDRVVVAVSGGADSVALAHALAQLRGVLDVSVVGLAHFNHELRPEAGEDEAFCRELAETLGVRWMVDRADVAAAARSMRRSVEDTARELRYAFLERARREVGASHIAVAHTQNDQAETVLLRLLRGAGPLGLRAIVPARGAVIRPLLDLSREEVEAYLARLGQRWRHDHTNDDLRHPRNRVRREVLPYLRQHFSPKILEGLARHAEQTRELSLWVEALATERASTVVLEGRDRVEVDVERLAREPLPLQRVLLLRALRLGAGGRFVGAEHVTAVEAVVTSGRPADLPGQRARLDGDRLVLGRRLGAGRGRRRGLAVIGDQRRGPGGEDRPAPVSLEVPGAVSCPGGWEVGAEPVTDVAGAKLDRGNEPGFAAVVACPDEARLFVRGRRPGDALEPVGLGGRKKLQDLFVDRKVARDERATWPIIVDARDRIIWVVGLAQAADFRVRDAERGVILLKAKRLGG